MEKRNSPYPFECQLKGASGTFQTKVLNVSPSGMLINTMSHPLLVNSSYAAQFSFPGQAGTCDVTVIVYKTYDEFIKHGLVQPGHHVSEVVFKTPSTEVSTALRRFLHKHPPAEKN